MSDSKKIKESISNQLQDMLDRRVETATIAIESAKESRDNETKSSVGDKYETGRAMMQTEVERHQGQLNNAENLKAELSRINFRKEYTKAEVGSLVLTDQGDYFISIGIGKIEVNNETYYAISIASPIGQVLHDKKVGDKAQFQDREFLIKNIV